MTATVGQRIGSGEPTNTDTPAGDHRDTVHQNARRLAELGWALTPVTIRINPTTGKKKAQFHLGWTKPEAFTTDPEQVTRWHKQHNPTAWAQSCTLNGVDVSDLDINTTANGIVTWRELGLPESTMRIRSNGGGWHDLWARDDDDPLYCQTARLPGVDTKSISLPTDTGTNSGGVTFICGYVIGSDAKGWRPQAWLRPSELPTCPIDVRNALRHSAKPATTIKATTTTTSLTPAPAATTTGKRTGTWTPAQAEKQYQAQIDSLARCTDGSKHGELLRVATWLGVFAAALPQWRDRAWTDIRNVWRDRAGIDWTAASKTFSDGWGYGMAKPQHVVSDPALTRDLVRDLARHGWDPVDVADVLDVFRTTGTRDTPPIDLWTALQVDQIFAEAGIDVPKEFLTDHTTPAVDSVPDIDDIRAELDGMDADAKMDRLIEVIPTLVDTRPAQLLKWEALYVKNGIGKRNFQAILKEAREARENERGTSKFLAEEYGGGGLAPDDGLLAGPDNPMPIARGLLAKNLWGETDGFAHIAWWRGDFYRYTGTRWAATEDSMINNTLYRATEGAKYNDPRYGIIPWPANRNTIGGLAHALGQGIVQRDPSDDDERCIACSNGVLDLATRELLPHHPSRFNLTSLPYDYDPDATCPQWERFLESVLPAQDERDMLQEWFGYVISGRTDQQKILHMFGAPRSGKGTILRILENLVGSDATTATTLQSLIGSFGEQPLIGKSLATIPDISWGIRDAGTAVEILKSISGEDSREINRKNRPHWHGKLGVRFVLACNDTPKFTDASGALASRLLNLRFRISFQGRENLALTSTLAAELSGILNWALVGFVRLDERGRFGITESSREAEEEIKRETNHVYGFIEDNAEYDANAPRRALDDLHGAYLDWCDAKNRKSPLSIEVFSRDLRSAGQGKIDVKRERLHAAQGGDGKRRAQWIYGLAESSPGSLVPRSGDRWLVGGEIVTRA